MNGAQTRTYLAGSLSITGAQPEAQPHHEYDVRRFAPQVDTEGDMSAVETKGGDYRNVMKMRDLPWVLANQLCGLHHRLVWDMPCFVFQSSFLHIHARGHLSN